MKANTTCSYKDLIVWQKGISLAKLVYDLTRGFPIEEKFGIVAQMRRAAISIPSNIAEGYGRQSLMDYLRFLRTARGSLAELDTQLELAIELRFVT